ncbi:hypothetical protein MVES1_002812 [Malassezia vespertilionis]|uniref:Uncharacterized protein n=1 Tax=Malassezia vespertilionis TaxID=2020962 RepID=A0A2N1JAG2_9BASI|nr:uncharacterized protein MVES1_002812 [Malassezia vespertilionis]PKI83534.1 hypothetical protein MVES_002656 [Malassezia vespertilionis]WFD07447.1 hypothetical protein MVES1_002812 [Malassezia vespertilionis]
MELTPLERPADTDATQDSVIIMDKDTQYEFGEGVDNAMLHPPRTIRGDDPRSVGGAANVLDFEAHSDYPTTEDQERETRQIESNLRQWSQQEKMQRKHSRRSSAIPMNSPNGLVRRFSTSLARVPSQIRSGTRRTDTIPDTAYEMTPSGYANNASTHDEGATFTSVGRSEDQALRPGVGTQAFDFSGNGGDLASISFDDFNDIKEPLAAEMPYASGSGAVRPARYDSPSAGIHDGIISPVDTNDSSFASAVETPEHSNMAMTMAKIRAHDFPMVTVGRASSLQYRNSQLPQHEPSLSPDMSTRAAAARAARRYTAKNGISAIPESRDGAELAEADLAAMPSDPLESPGSTLRSADALSTDGKQSDTAAAGLRASSLHQDAYSRPVESMRLDTEQHELEAQRERDHAWLLSDLVFGCCGLCTTDGDDEEQAARTNPME